MPEIEKSVELKEFPQFLGLPSDIIHLFFEYLDQKTIASLAVTCTVLHNHFDRAFENKKISNQLYLKVWEELNKRPEDKKRNVYNTHNITEKNFFLNKEAAYNAVTGYPFRFFYVVNFDQVIPQEQRLKIKIELFTTGHKRFSAKIPGIKPEKIIAIEPSEKFKEQAPVSHAPAGTAHLATTPAPTPSNCCVII